MATKERTKSVSTRSLSRYRIPEPKQLPKLVEQMRRDYMVSFSEQILRSLVGKIKTTIDVDGDPRANVLAANLEEQFAKSMTFALDAIAYGRSAFEKTYRFESGAWLLECLDYLPFESSEMVLQPDGQVAVKLPAVKDVPATTLDPGDCWWFALDPTPTQPHGRSKFLGAPQEVFKDRRALERQEDIWYQKYAMGQGIVKAPAEMPKQGTRGKGDKGEVGVDGQPIDPLTEMQRRCTEIESGGWFVLSSERDPKTGQPLYEVTPSQAVKDTGPWDVRRTSLDKQILQAFGIPPLAVMQDSATGSYSLGLVHQAVLESTVEGIHRQLVESYQKNVIDPAVALNFAGGQAKLTLSAQQLSGQLKSLIVDLVKSIIASGQPSPLVTEGVIDLPRMLEVAEIPIGENVEQRMAAVQSAAKAAPVAPPGFGPPRMFATGVIGPSVPAPSIPADENAILAEVNDPLWAKLKAAMANRNHLPRGSL